MPCRYERLERQVVCALQQALSDKHMDVADHLLCALEALDPEFEGPAISHAPRATMNEGQAAHQEL